MAAVTLEDRVANLERDVAGLKRRLDEMIGGPQPWWERICGTFQDDPVFDEAMRLGREYRESLREGGGEDAPREQPGAARLV